MSMKTKLFSGVVLALLGATTVALAETETPAYGEMCGVGIDWRDELLGGAARTAGGVWQHLRSQTINTNSKISTWESLGPESAPNPYAIDKWPQGYAGSQLMADSYVEAGDLIFKRLDNGTFNDFHTGLFREMTYGIVSSFTAKMTGVMQHAVWEGVNADSTKTISQLIDVDIDLLATNDMLVNQFQLAQDQWASRWGTNNGLDWRGVRRPSPTTTGGTELTLAQRKAILGKAQTLSNNNIDYIFESMIDQTNRWPPGWEGTTGDIDQLRCDGFAEFAYEDSGVRLWGSDSRWNLGSASDDNYDYHKNSWEGFDFTLDEVSPMIQAGCGGYGEGQRTTMRSPTYKRAPRITTFPRTLNPPVGYFEVDVVDKESSLIYVTLQVRDVRTQAWSSITDLQRVSTDVNGRYAFSYQWNGTVRDRAGTRQIPVSSANYSYRLVAVDQGGNVSLKEFNRDLIRLSGTGEARSYVFRAPRTAYVAYSLDFWPDAQTGDFDMQVVDLDTGRTLDSASAGAGITSEAVDVFVRENQRYEVRVYSYNGAGNYAFRESYVDPGFRYQIDQMLVTRAEGGWEVNFPSMPFSTVWAITWSRWNQGRDLDMEARLTNGALVTSTSTSDWESVRVAPDGTNIASVRVYDFHRGAGFANPEEAKNLFHLWGFTTEN
jgi:hypothetical protein